MKRLPVASITSIGVFVVCMAFLFLPERANMDNTILLVCGGYGLVCLLFLFFQLYAFVKAHTEYHEEVEAIKYKVFEVEGIPLKEVMGDHEKEIF